MAFLVGDSVLDVTYGYGMVCSVIRNPDETYPVICRFWQKGRPVEAAYTRDGFNDVSDAAPSLVHAKSPAPDASRLAAKDYDEEYRELFGGKSRS